MLIMVHDVMYYYQRVIYFNIELLGEECIS